MKKIEVIVRPEKVNSVILALEAAGYLGITVYEVAGHGKRRDVGDEVTLRPMVKLEVAVKDSDTDKIVKLVMDTAYTGTIGDGRILISDLNEVFRIRTKERGDKAAG